MGSLRGDRVAYAPLKNRLCRLLFELRALHPWMSGGHPIGEGGANPVGVHRRQGPSWGRAAPGFGTLPRGGGGGESPMAAREGCREG